MFDFAMHTHFEENSLLHLRMRRNCSFSDSGIWPSPLTELAAVAVEASVAEVEAVAVEAVAVGAVAVGAVAAGAVAA